MTLDTSDTARADDHSEAHATQRPPAPSRVDRTAALRAGTPRMSRRIVYVTAAIVLFLGVGGALAQHFVTSPAVRSTASSPTGAHKAPISQGSAPSGSAELHAPLASFMGLSSLRGANAAGFVLTDAVTGTSVTLSSLRGHVVVLSFANAACNDICPVLAQELVQADALLGTTKRPVTFITINTDPLAFKPSEAAIATATRLGTLANWQFLTGSVRELDKVWVSYGIAITADSSTGAAAHNDLMYFIGPAGRMSWSATPFADESKSGTFSLTPASIARFAQGIAHYADRLAGAA